MPLQTFSASQESQHIQVHMKVLYPTFPKEQKDNLILQHTEAFGHMGIPSQIWDDASAAFTSPGHARLTLAVGLSCEKVPIRPRKCQGTEPPCPSLIFRAKVWSQENKDQGQPKPEESRLLCCHGIHDIRTGKSNPRLVFTVNHTQAPVSVPTYVLPSGFSSECYYIAQ